MAKFTTGISGLNEVAGSEVMMVRRGWQGNLQGLVKDADNDPVDISGNDFTAVAEFYNATIIGEVVSDPIIDNTKPARTLTFTKDVDQNTNKGKFTLFIPSDLFEDNVLLDSDVVPLAIIWIQRDVGVEQRISLFSIGCRRGIPSGG